MRGPSCAPQCHGLMVKQPGATCPGNPGGVTAGLGQVRHRPGRGVDLEAGGIGLGASAERLRDRSPPTVSTVGFSAQEFAAEEGAALRTIVTRLRDVVKVTINQGIARDLHKSNHVILLGFV